MLKLGKIGDATYHANIEAVGLVIKKMISLINLILSPPPPDLDRAILSLGLLFEHTVSNMYR